MARSLITRKENPLELGRPRPVVFKGHELVLHAGLPVGKHKGAGAVAVGTQKLVGRLRLDPAVFGYVIFVHDGPGGRLHEQAEEEGAGGVEGDGHLELARGLDALRAQAGLEELGGREVEGKHPPEAERDVLGGEIGAVMKFDALPNLKRVRLVVVGDRPGLGQPRFDLGRAHNRAVVSRRRVVADQRVVDVVRHPGGRRVGADMWVNPGRFKVDAEVEHLRVGLREPGSGNRRHKEDEADKELFHLSSLEKLNVRTTAAGFLTQAFVTRICEVSYTQTLAMSK